MGQGFSFLTFGGSKNGEGSGEGLSYKELGKIIVRGFPRKSTRKGLTGGMYFKIMISVW